MRNHKLIYVFSLVFITSAFSIRDSLGGEYPSTGPMTVGSLQEFCEMAMPTVDSVITQRKWGKTKANAYKLAEGMTEPQSIKMINGVIEWVWANKLKPANMSKEFLKLCLGKSNEIAFMFTLPVWSSADLEKGFEAVERGDFAAARRVWEPLAEQGNLVAQYNLGRMYDMGAGVPQNYKAAFKWYRLSAEKGNPPAQHNLGLMYEKGTGVPQSYVDAARWYRLSAEQGYVGAQSNLGVLYYIVKGMRDYPLSYMWISIAASQGEPNAIGNLRIIKKVMTSSEIAKAQKRADNCIRKAFKNC